jgi:hypothetical protein
MIMVNEKATSPLATRKKIDGSLKSLPNIFSLQTVNYTL